MIKLQKLISDLCPDGVPRVRIDDLIAYEQPTKYLVASKSYDDSYSTPVLTAGQTFLLGYTNEEDGKYPASADSPVIIFDDFTTAYKWVDFEFKVKSSAMKMLTVKAGAQILLRYFWYSLSTIQIDTSEHAQYWISKISELEILLPPLEIQEEIVRILDTFTELEAELEAELNARKSQYDFYRTRLLSFRDVEGVRWIPMGNLLQKLNSYAAIEKSEYKRVGQFPIINQAQELIAGYSDREELALPNGHYIIFGDHTRAVKYFDRPFIPGESGTLVFSIEEICRPKYLYFAFKNLEIQSRGYNRHWSVVRNMEIPVPSLEIQDEIITVLEIFSELTGEFSGGLPAEIRARRQQYEYYRGKLLTFKELEVA